MRPRAAVVTAVLATLLLGAVQAVQAAPAEAGVRRPWPGHPDRVLVDHLVRPGDTATGLATRYHAWTRELVALNHLGPRALLRVGERLRIPVVVSAARRAKRATSAHTAPQPAPQPVTQPVAQPAPPPSLVAQGWRHWRMSRAEVREAIGRTARRHGVPVALAQAVGWQESGWHQPVRSPAGAIGVMQVLPPTGLWMSLYAGRPLDLLDTHDNITAGVTLLGVLLRELPSTRKAVGAYYQGLGAVTRRGLYPETKAYVANVLAIRDRLGR